HQLLVFKNKGEIDFYYGNYSEFLEEKTEETVLEKKPEPQLNRTEKKKKKLTYAESKEWEEIEGNMEQVEHRLKDITTEMSAAGSDFEKVRLLLEEEKELTDKLEYTMERWTYLAEKLEEE
ncbi:ABC transporter ATP-binding protein, partial [Peribacillus sp. NPDC060186]